MLSDTPPRTPVTEFTCDAASRARESWAAIEAAHAATAERARESWAVIEAAHAATAERAREGWAVIEAAKVAAAVRLGAPRP